MVSGYAEIKQFLDAQVSMCEERVFCYTLYSKKCFISILKQVNRSH